MANGSARITIAVVFLLIGGLIGFLIGNAGKRKGGEPESTMTAAHKPAPTKKHIVVIGPSADHLSEDKVSVSKSNPREVIWLSNEEQSLEITFPVNQPDPSFPPQAKDLPPFEDMEKKGDEWVFKLRPCGSGKCFSGAINDKLDPEHWGDLKYKYDQTLAGDKKDGWIVIQK